jgi:hypothetical protein
MSPHVLEMNWIDATEMWLNINTAHCSHPLEHHETSLWRRYLQLHHNFYSLLLRLTHTRVIFRSYCYRLQHLLQTSVGTWPNDMKQSFRPSVAHSASQIPAFSETWMFITVFTGDCNWSCPEPDESNLHPKPNLPKIHFNTVLPPMPRSSL